MIRIILFSLFASSLALPVAAQNSDSAGANWNSSWGFATTAERSLGLSQAQTQRAARMAPAAGPVTYETVYNNTTNTNTVGAMNTGDTTVTVTGDGNSLNTTSTADSAGCLDGSVGFTTVDTGATGATLEYNFALNDAGTANNCILSN